MYLFSNRFSKEQLKKLLEKQKGKSFYIPSHNEIKEFSEKGYLSNNTNEPCYCGSGKKIKKDHSTPEKWPVCNFSVNDPFRI